MNPTNNSSDINKLFEAFTNNLGNDPKIQGDEQKAIDKLVSDLNQYSYSKQRDEIIEKAKKGHYSDFSSPLSMPKMQLIADLQAAGLNQIAEQAMNGAYDT